MSEHQVPWGDEWDAVHDLIVVGTGAAGATAAAIAAAAGADVLVVDKSQFTGGTTAKSGGVFWVPDNPLLREDGIVDERAGALRYMARTAFPTRYNAQHASLGLEPREYQLLCTFFDRGHDVLQQLSELGVWQLERVAYPDYYADVPEDLVPQGRVLQAAFPEGWRRGLDPSGGQLLTDALLRVAAEHGAVVRTGCEVAHLVHDDDGAVIGLETRIGARTALFGARRGVVFASGGFLHNRELTRAHLRGPVLGGGASETATGDFVRIGIEAGAQLGNMSHAWWDQLAVEHAVTVPATIRDVYSPFGDSMLMVNRYGHRVVNEKAVYNERSQVHFAWDPSRYEYPNLLLFWILDRHVIADPTPARFRWPIPLTGEPMPDLLIQATDIDDLATQLTTRLARLAPHTGDAKLDESFRSGLLASITRFNEMAVAGRDDDFRRGESAIEKVWAGAGRDGLPNPTMAPLDLDGPLYCVILGPGALDTKGGPVIDEHARVLRTDGQPIPKLFGAGNCIASPAGQAYWGPGGTIGPAIVFGAVAATSALAGL